MNYLIFMIVITTVIAGIIGVFMFVEAVLTWLHLRLMKKHSVETTARILYTEVLDDTQRHTPFVKLLIEADTADGHCFIAEAESFFPKHKLSTLHSGSPVLIRYNPQNTSQVLVVKKPLPLVRQNTTWKPIIKQPGYQFFN